MLNNRASKIHHIEYDTKKLNKVISELYSYRSAIAHGGDVKNKLKEVTRKLEIKAAAGREEYVVSNLLRRIVKMVLIQALKEPKLVTDLK